MPLYAMLMKLTDQGAKDIKAAPGRIEAGIKGYEKLGGKLIGFYVCQGGEYDYIAIAEGPGDEVDKVFKMALESLGNVRCSSVRLYTPAEFAGLVAKLPWLAAGASRPGLRSRQLPGLPWGWWSVPVVSPGVTLSLRSG